jgi:glutamate/tyrosine decarboxylase-like PLP-dependent enzyme
MKPLLEDAARRAIRYQEDLKTRGVAPVPEAVAGLEALKESLPLGPSDPAETLRFLDEIVSPTTMATSGPRFFGLVIGGALPATVAASWLAAVWDQPSSFERVTPGTARLEEVSLAWLLDVLGLPLASGGAFVTGATVANLCGLAAARHAVLAAAGWDAEAEGLFGAPPITVVVGAEAHPSLFKSLGILGLGRQRVVTVPADGQGRIVPEAFPQLSGPAIVCLQAGNVNTGAFDPFEPLCERAHECGAWVHVDGAFGLWAAADPVRAHLTEGLAKADSWATDAHKWLNVPYDSGLAIVRDASSLRAAMALAAAYLPSGARRDPCDYTPEASRRARGVEVWAALRSLGRSGLAELIERNCRHAQRFAEAFAAAGHEVLNEVVLNQVLVSFGEPETTNRVIREIQAEGTCWCGGTVWHGRTAMRVSVSNWSTTEEDVERSLDVILRLAARRG